MGTIKVSRSIPNSEVQDEYDGPNRNDGLYVNNTNYAQVVNGLSIVVYDPDLGLVVDSAGVNVYLGLGMVRNIEIDF